MISRNFSLTRSSAIIRLAIVSYLLSEVTVCLGAPFSDLDVLTLIDPITQFEEESEPKKVVVKSVFNVPIKTTPTDPPCPDGTRRVTEGSQCVSQISGIKLDDQFLLQSFSYFNRRRPTTQLTTPHRRRKTTTAQPPLAVPTYVIEEADQSPSNLRPVNPIYNNNPQHPVTTVTLPLNPPNYYVSVPVTQPSTIMTTTEPTTSTTTEAPILESTTAPSSTMNVSLEIITEPSVVKNASTTTPIDQTAVDELKETTVLHIATEASPIVETDTTAFINEATTEAISTFNEHTSSGSEAISESLHVNSTCASSSSSEMGNFMEETTTENSPTEPSSNDTVVLSTYEETSNQTTTLELEETRFEPMAETDTMEPALNVSTATAEVDLTTESETVGASDGTQIVFYDPPVTAPEESEATIRFPQEEFESTISLTTPSLHPKPKAPSLSFQLFFVPDFKSKMPEPRENTDRLIFPED